MILDTPAVNILTLLTSYRLNSSGRTKQEWEFYSSFLMVNQWYSTSNLWELTFFPFLDHTIFGLGSPEVWQINDATPPEAPVWSMGVLVNFGGAIKKESNKSDPLITSVSVAMYYYISLNKLNYDITSLLDLWELLKTALFQVHVHDSKGICRRHLQCEFHGAHQYSDHKYIQILD